MSFITHLQSKITNPGEAQFWWAMGATGPALMFGPLAITYAPFSLGEPWDTWLEILMTAVALLGVLWFWVGLFALNRGDAP